MTTEERNDDLFNIRQRMQMTRSNLQDSNSKYMDLQIKQSELVNKLAELETHVTQKDNTKQLTFEDLASFISEWSSSTLQPVLNELVDDFEKMALEIKELNLKVASLEKNQVQIKVSDDDVANSVQSEKKSFASGIPAKLSLQKKK
jgi:predicted  nucleic acid-binding Zn-ribbon protein